MLFGKGEAKDKDFQRNKSQKSFDVIGFEFKGKYNLSLWKSREYH